MDSSRDRRVALLPIRPEFAEQLLDGTKRVEFRRRPLPGQVTVVVIYSTAPDSGITGYFAVDGQDVAATSTLWERYGSVGGIVRRRLRDYLRGAANPTAILAGTVCRVQSTIKLDEVRAGLSAPQGFCYLSDLEFERLQAHSVCPAD